MRIVLSGPKCSGKSQIGRALSIRLKLEFIETDIETEILFFNEHNRKLTCRGICEEYGEDFFRDYEKRAIEKVSELDKCVISTGGSSLLNPNSLSNLSKNSIMILLDTNIEVLLSRWVRKGVTTYLNSKNPKETFVKRAITVKNLLRESSDIIIDNSYMTMEETLLDILDKLKMCPKN